MSTHEPFEQHLTVQEVASRLAVSEETIRRMIRRGDLPALRVGHNYRLAGSIVLQCCRSATHDRTLQHVTASTRRSKKI